jgi:hypothetical protein
MLPIGTYGVEAEPQGAKLTRLALPSARRPDPKAEVDQNPSREQHHARWWAPTRFPALLVSAGAATTSY